jgi:hypothetical protein
MSRQEYSQRGRLLVAAWVQLLTLIDRIIVLFDERGLMTVDCIIRVDATRAVMREATPSQNKQPAYLQVAQQNRQNDFHHYYPHGYPKLPACLRRAPAGEDGVILPTIPPEANEAA